MARLRTQAAIGGNRPAPTNVKDVNVKLTRTLDGEGWLLISASQVHGIAPGWSLQPARSDRERRNRSRTYANAIFRNREPFLKPATPRNAAPPVKKYNLAILLDILTVVECVSERVIP
jgi:hypothetical protein